VHDFLGEYFSFEKIAWVPMGEAGSVLSVLIEGTTTDFSIGETLYKNSISVENIQSHFESAIDEKQYSSSVRVLRFLARLSSNLPKYQNAWVFIDRDVQADDNAEHLYRYVLRKNTRTNIRFVLRKNSHDWQRLKRDGFNLIPFGSVRHMIILFNARHLISSHADVYVFDFPPQSWFKGILKYHYTFLQHGIIKHDLSTWLNEKPIDLFVTTSKREYLSIAGEKNRYKYTPKEVCLTGLARHDALLEKHHSSSTTNKKMTLLIIPTWRQNVTGKTLWMSNKRVINNDFYDSQFAQSWKSLLHSNMLKKLATNYDLDITFFPHANITPYFDWFDVPSYIKSVVHQKDSSIQDLFVEASVMLTDYSSVDFEMAYLEKPVIYYQFDSDDVFGGVHTTSKGYFDYTKDGFGPVCETESALLAKLKQILENNAKLEEIYLERTKETFKFKDGKCCKRIYNAILDLDGPST
jgi:CDP-glycerol glycerophosphotransferase (TagB/SpsB family)